MFKSKTDLGIVVDSVTKPFWTTGDVISGNVRLVNSLRLQVDSIKISLVCEEKAEVASQKQNTVSRDRRRHFPNSVQSHSRSNTHYVSRQDVLGYDPASTPHILEAGEYLFPFTIELTSDIDQSPPHMSVIGENGLKTSVNWLLKVTVNKTSKISRNIRSKQEIRVYPRGNLLPRAPTKVLTNTSKQAELSGQKAFCEQGSIWSKLVNSRRTIQGTLDVILKFPAQGLPQTPQPAAFQLKVNASNPVQLNLINIELVQRCDVMVKGASDTYTSKKLICCARVSRRVEGEVDLTTLITGATLPEFVPLSFKTNLITVSYEIQVTTDFTAISETLQKPTSFTISTPVDILSPKLDILPGYEKHLSFNEPVIPISQLRNLGKENYAGSATESRVSGVTSGTSGTWGSTDIPGPSEYFSNWLSGIVKSNS